MLEAIGKRMFEFFDPRIKRFTLKFAQFWLLLIKKDQSISLFNKMSH